jgi:hypothetical protein
MSEDFDLSGYTLFEIKKNIIFAMRQYNFLWHLISINFLIAGLLENQYQSSPVVLSQTPAIFTLKCDNMGKGIDLSGKRFNRLLVINKAKRLSPKEGIRWNCLCDCGNYTIVRSDGLKQNRTKSCGCFERELNSLASIEVIISKMPSNSKLTPICRLSETLDKKHKDYSKIYCQCECGKFTCVESRSLISGGTVSCGCHARKILLSRITKFTNNNPVIYSIYRSMIARCYTITKNGYKNYYKKGVKVCDEWKNDYQKFLDWCLENGWQKGLQLDKDIKGNGMLYSPETCCFVTARDNGLARENVNKIVFNGSVRTVREVGRELGISATTIRRRYSNGWSLYDACTVPVIRNKLAFLAAEKKYNKNFKKK